jgi:tRNA threonylcarbamoyladenosine biosynthesis protein TsaB
MISLGISTSTERGSVALVEGERVLASEAWLHLEGHAERLFAALDRVFAQARVSRAELGVVGCDIGPGSFTGVRVGVASAQGIALGLGLRMVPVLSFEAMAHAARHADAGGSAHEACVVAIDAKKDEAFLAELVGGERAGELLHLPRAEASRWLEAARDRGLRIVGSFAAELVEGALRSELSDLPHAIAVAELANERAARAVEVAELAPEYVRAPDAKPQMGGSPAASAQSST